MGTTPEIEMVQTVYQGINQNDIDLALKFCDFEMVRVEPEGFPMSGTYRGRAEMVEHFLAARASWAEGSCTPENFVVSGNMVLAYVHVLVRLKNKTEWIDGHAFDLFTFRNGKIVEMRTFVDRIKAEEWAGIKE